METNRLFPFRLTFDSPVTLFFVGAALMITITPGSNAWLRLDPIGPLNLVSPRWYLGLVGHVFAHQNLTHFVGNAALLLLLGPGIERALGPGRYFATLAGLTLLTGLSASVILVFTQRSLIGASGLVFALIFVHALRGTRRNEIPVSAVLLAVLWGTKELAGLFDQSRIANSAHLNGAFWGFVFGMYLLRSDKTESA